MYVFKIEQGKELEDRCSVGTMTTTHIHTQKKTTKKGKKHESQPEAEDLVIGVIPLPPLRKEALVLA